MATILAETSVEIGVAGSMATILTRLTRSENRPRKVEDCQLQIFLGEDDTQSQKMLAEQLGVSQAAISMRLLAMGKVQKKMSAA